MPAPIPDLVLEHEIARQIKETPGCNQAQIARELGRPSATVKRYIKRLIHAGMIYGARVGSELRLYEDSAKDRHLARR